LVCPGYDRTVDDFFFDETAKVRAKVNKAKAKAIAARDARDAQEAPEMALSRVDRLACLSPQLIAPLIDQGITYFVSNYATGLEKPPVASEAYNQHSSTHGFHPLVAATMTAVGLAGVANLYLDPRLRREATQWYLRAIKMLNTAIASPVAARQDSTLVAVNLLSLFEATSNDENLASWSSHVDGAALIIKMRGPNQFSTPAGRRMYLQTIGLVTANCLGKGIAMPDYVHDLNPRLKDYLDDKDPRSSFFFLHMETTDLRAYLIKNPTADLYATIERALNLDCAAKDIFDRLVDDWKYETVPCPSGMPGVYGDSYHVYPAHIAAQTWNWVRYNRIYYHDIIRNCILAGLSTSPPILTEQKYVALLGESTSTLARLQSDIYASMSQFLYDTPQVLPYIPDEDYNSSPRSTDERETSPFSSSSAYTTTQTSSGTYSTTSSASLSSSNDPHSRRRMFFQNFRNEDIPHTQHFMGRGGSKELLPIVRISGGYSTLWALYVAGSMPTASPESQEYALQCFGRIERDFGINQAVVLANALRIKQRMVNGGEKPFALCPAYLPAVLLPPED
jgi:hypothetical protein